MKLSQIAIANWYAIVLIIWLIPTMLAAILLPLLGGMGPLPDPSSRSSPPYLALAIWFAIPFIAGFFGLSARSDQE